ncbi:PilW family protein [Vibrio japonicus]|uniref:Prepilin-type N-terminal cleavage/methylation domain-containing protein n=1 Tax=Vibrio japonicus TaxID=1824638 RepID=A0ABY5LFW2_9VIBR|nr:prepilin-type N-terminal cleavage/methylation domain-containing protein [Vibrio japonicus]UUM30914.1 prepilin-type N-terminal cleavage/methylation domain-containing protein [Vibrio japonicus]
MNRKGFTLIEMVITLIVGSILVFGIAGFVELGARGYSDTIERQRLQTQAKFVLEKISREVRHAVPNMLSDELISGANCLSFYPIITSGFYAVSGADLQFVVGSKSASVDTIKDLSLVINPTVSAASQSNIFPLTSVTSDRETFYLAGMADEVKGNSVSNRHYIFDAQGKVSYCIINQRVQRLENGLDVTPISDSGVLGQLSYDAATVQHNGVVSISLTFTNEKDDESTSFQQKIQVLNVP